VRSEARIIDANSNRAGEGLRVLEDLARFALDDGELSERAKRARHLLAELVGGLPLPAGLRVSVRDTPGDVGTAITTPTEGHRADLASVAAAAVGRATEAIRVIEEIAKAIGGAGGPFETLRYEAYEIDRLVRAALVPASPQWRLCVLISEDLCGGRPWESVAEAAIAGGADCLQLREKTLHARELVARARRLVALRDASAAGVSIVINDRPDVALLARADAVHVGQRDLTPADVRAVAGAGMPVGISTSSIPEAVGALTAGASSVGLGPMFPTSTKHKDTIAGEAYLRAFLADERVAHLPHLCIGGVTPRNAPALIRAGARGLAVSSAVCAADDPAGVCRELLAAFDAG
jgi:thiamine-phosphate pyrophosphorylase